MTDLTTRDLPTLERVIEGGLRTFVDVGQALLEIRDGRLYRDQHPTFEDYCKRRWGWERAHAYRLMDAATVVNVVEMSPIGDIAPPTNEAQARELARLKEPEAIRETWAAVVDEHGDDVTAADVRAAVEQRRPWGPPPHWRAAAEARAQDTQREADAQEAARDALATEIGPAQPFTFPPEPEASPEEKAYDALQRQRLLTRFDPVALADVVPSPADALPGFEAYTDWLTRFTEALSERARNPLRLAK